MAGATGGVARRFFCDALGCPRCIFVEPFPGILAPSARQTERWWQALLELAQASSAEVEAHVAWFLGYRASPDTLIRRQRAERFAFPSPRVLGVDAFALRRGRTSGTLLMDLERHQPVAVLEGRTAEPLTTWLQAHPTVAILVHDRAGAYALAARQVASDALRWQHARQLDHELVQRGYRGSESMVRVVVPPWRTRREGSPPALTPSQRSRLLLQQLLRLALIERSARNRAPFLAHNQGLTRMALS